MCNERSEQEEKGDFNHSCCKYVQLSKSCMQLVLDGDELINRMEIIEEANKKAEKKMEKKAEGEKIVDRKEVELAEAIASIMNTPTEEQSEVREEEEVFPLGKRVRRLSMSSSDEDDGPLATSSPKAPIARQQPFDPRKESVHPSQTKAVESLTSRLAATQATLKAVREERDLHIVKQELIKKWQEKVASVTADNINLKKEKESLEREMSVMKEEEKRRNMEKEKKMTEMLGEMMAKEKELEELKLEMSKLAEDHKRQLKETVLEIKKTALQQRRQRTVLGHLACYGGRVIEKRWEEVDLDSTMVCFHNPTSGVHCHHVTVRTVDEHVGLTVQNVRTEVIGKK